MICHDPIELNPINHKVKVVKKILLLGLGRVGKVFTHLATDFSITVFDMQPPPASLASLASLGVTALEKTSLAALTPADLSPFDLVVNFLPVACNEQILPLVAETNCGYLDLATNEVDVPEQVAYRPYFSNRLFLANAGIAPGLDNLLVARLIKSPVWVRS